MLYIFAQMVFETRFQIPASRERVREFHDSTSALRKLTPPGTLIRIHRFGRLEDGMVAEFTLWLGPFPIQWRALHRDVSESGFTDIQVQGPMKRWEHTHRFIPLGDRVSEVHERIEYDHHSGLRGIISRVLFNRCSLGFLFIYRAWATRRGLSNRRKGSAE